MENSRLVFHRNTVQLFTVPTKGVDRSEKGFLGHITCIFRFWDFLTRKTSYIFISSKYCQKRVVPHHCFRFDQDQTNNTNVYVTGLPTSNFNLEMFANLMKKCGLIKPDEKTQQPKLKLYFDSEVQSLTQITGKTNGIFRVNSKVMACVATSLSNRLIWLFKFWMVQN